MHFQPTTFEDILKALPLDPKDRQIIELKHESELERLKKDHGTELALLKKDHDHQLDKLKTELKHHGQLYQSLLRSDTAATLLDLPIRNKIPDLENERSWPTVSISTSFRYGRNAPRFGHKE